MREGEGLHYDTCTSIWYERGGGVTLYGMREGEGLHYDTYIGKGVWVWEGNVSSMML